MNGEENISYNYMWDYQQSFLYDVQVSAERLLKLIDRRLKPKVFLLGILIVDRKDRSPICFEPDNCGYSPKAFSEVKELVHELEKFDEESKLINSSIPTYHAGRMKRINKRAYIEAVSKILRKEAQFGDTEKYISYPTFVDGYFVMVILEAQKEVIDKHYSLSKDRSKGYYNIDSSFIESAIDIFLNTCSVALKDPYEDFNSLKKPTDALLREAGNRLMDRISQIGQLNMHGLYGACNIISSLRYEGAESLGKLVIARKDHPNIKMILQVEEPIEIKDYVKVRKFLELSNDKTLIISDSVYIYGLGEFRGKYNPKEESLFIINFTKHYHWELLHDNNQLMMVSYRNPCLPVEKVDRDKFYSDLKRVFTEITLDQMDNLWDITLEAIEQKNGTMLVITDIVESESKRLGKQCFKIKPQKLTKDIINQITSIDGCVLMDKDSMCYAIGVILDGLATEKGDSSRGARYNSAIRYYEYMGKKYPTFIIIISEDGLINYLPDLMPQIKHSVITNGIEELEKLNSLEKADKRIFNKMIDFFENNEFYLSKEECERINELREMIEKKDRETESIGIIRRKLLPNDEMNDSFFLNE
ncbi:MAG: diadenylate cyclase [Bacteroidota bacterium]|nr:diadenylate cyclase [Bacteroidota bacterium]